MHTMISFLFRQWRQKNLIVSSEKFFRENLNVVDALKNSACTSSRLHILLDFFFAYSLQFIASFCRKDELDHADYFTTLYCCRKYQRVYDTKFMYEVESSSRKPRCVWSRDHPIYSWIMHSKMSACCTSLDRTVDYSMPTVSNLVTTR